MDLRFHYPAILPRPRGPSIKKNGLPRALSIAQPTPSLLRDILTKLQDSLTWIPFQICFKIWKWALNDPLTVVTYLHDVEILPPRYFDLLLEALHRGQHYAADLVSGHIEYMKIRMEHIYAGMGDLDWKDFQQRFLKSDMPQISKDWFNAYFDVHPFFTSPEDAIRKRICNEIFFEKAERQILDHFVALLHHFNISHSFQLSYCPEKIEINDLRFHKENARSCPNYLRNFDQTAYILKDLKEEELPRISPLIDKLLEIDPFHMVPVIFVPENSRMFVSVSEQKYPLKTYNDLSWSDYSQDSILYP